MKPSVPLLTPILRSDTQGRVLAELFSKQVGNNSNSAGQSISELARLVHAALPTVLRDVDRLTASGILKENRVARGRLVKVNTEHPLYEALRTIVMFGYGPVAVLPGLLSVIPGVDEAYIFGSWAARAAGEAGAEPEDIDVLVVGDVDSGSVYEVSRDASKQLGREVNVTAVSRARWDSESDGFIQTVKSRPLEKLELDRPTVHAQLQASTMGDD